MSRQADIYHVHGMQSDVTDQPLIHLGYPRS
jgi:hypothetical protein